MSNQEKTSMKPSGNFFVFYCIVLFMFAAILITISFLSKENVEQQLEHTSEKASGFESRLEQVNARNGELETTIYMQKVEIDELSNQVTEATSMLSDNKKKIDATDKLVELMIACANEDLVRCREIIATTFSGNGDLRAYLSQTGLAELVRIENITKGE